MGLAFAGIAIYTVINFAAAIIALSLARDSDTAPVVLGAGAVLLALVALGGGAALLFVRRPWATGLGMGLMIGWAISSIVTAGYCTGLNPGLYG
ncbi:hypothetical protein [Sphaerisporangium rufum]|uniref:hypothetical protein n=1 Tax=Sphaerisporangium rufum TaxID=1381558 RepID=UPI00194FAD34|nr:hypothetical protein [Sphaerisporangium rufum]